MEAKNLFRRGGGPLDADSGGGREKLAVFAADGRHAPCQTTMTLAHLLTHTSGAMSAVVSLASCMLRGRSRSPGRGMAGLSYGFDVSGATSPVDKLYHQHGFSVITPRHKVRHPGGGLLSPAAAVGRPLLRCDRGCGLQRRDFHASSAAFVDALATMPLAAEPGAEWNCAARRVMVAWVGLRVTHCGNLVGLMCGIDSFATDVLGRVVEVAADQPLAAFFQQHVFDPLGMHGMLF